MKAKVLAPHLASRSTRTCPGAATPAPYQATAPGDTVLIGVDIVAYKVDRLTRSLADFARLVEIFDQEGVSS